MTVDRDQLMAFIHQFADEARRSVPPTVPVRDGPHRGGRAVDHPDGHLKNSRSTGASASGATSCPWPDRVW